MKKRRKFWRYSVGGYGYTVTACARANSPYLYLTWYDAKQKKVWRSLEHADRGKAEGAAKQLSASLLVGQEAHAEGSVTVAEVFGGWERDRGSKRKRPKEDNRRADLWQGFLTGTRDMYSINRRVIDQFVEQRRRGLGELGPVSMYTVGEDVRWLKTVCNWAVAGELLQFSPMGFADRVYLRQFRNVNVKRPRATQEHFEKVLKKAGTVNFRFPYWLRFVHALGWRESAICQLRRSDFDTRTRKQAPHGRILKRAESDKMGVERWVPMSRELRTAFNQMMREFPTVGDVFLFPGVRTKKKPWSRFYASKLLKRAEKDAKVQDHYPPHAYRRKWVNDRKTYPRADVAAAGAWLSVRTLEIYEQPDEATLFEVMDQPRKEREA